MTNEEALEKIIFDYKFKEKVESGYVYHTEIPFMEAIANIMEDLEILDIIKKKAQGNRFFKGCLLRMFQEDGEKKTILDNPQRKIEKEYYKIKEWLDEK